MNFHLQFQIPASEKKISYDQNSMLLGSCFAENFGAKLSRYKFNSCINPHGVLYNPASIAAALRRFISDAAMEEQQLFYANDCWNSWEHHSRFSAPDKQSCLLEINNKIHDAHGFLKEAHWLFITFGSAYTYVLKESGQIAGNCHKAPQQQFIKSLLTVNSIVEEYTLLIKKLRELNPNLNIVFTISPVRYIRDGVVENNLSKSILINAVHNIVKQNSNTFYFPAYELVIDDLRDYRFYNADLVHPNEQAIDYVFTKLMDAFFDAETKIIFEAVSGLIAAKEHRPFNAEAASHKQFKEAYLKRTEQLQAKYPFLDLQDEKTAFS